MSPNSVLNIKTSVDTVKTGIEKDSREELAEELSIVLADTYILYLKTQGVHWNVVGPVFYGLHKLTEEQYSDLANAIDEIAERIRALGYPAPASFTQFMELSTLQENSSVESVDLMLSSLVKDNEKISKSIRRVAQTAENADDVYTSDLLTSRVGVHEKAAWMLRSLSAE